MSTETPRVGAIAVLLGALLALMTAGAARAMPRFEDVSAQVGIGEFEMDLGMGGGVAAADFDNDGDVDLFVPNGLGMPDQLYRNLGNGRFEEIAASVGLASTTRSRAALWVDIDGDRRLDLFVVSDCLLEPADCEGIRPLKLYRQRANGQFEDITYAAGFEDFPLTHQQQQGGLSAGDIDNDGDLDIVTGVWQGLSRVYKNRGNGTFKEVAERKGLGQFDFYWQPVLHDFNRDGWIDIFHAIDFGPNRLWINKRGKRFVDVAQAAGVDNDWNDMGVTLGDIDNDGDFDIYITNIWEWQPGRRNILFINDTQKRQVTFTKVLDAGVEDGGWGWGTTFLDADNDGDLDLAATNGWVEGDRWVADPSNFFLNEGGSPPIWTDASEMVGFDDTSWGSALVAADLDRDGDLDMVQTVNGWGASEPSVRVLDNEQETGNHFLVVKPRMKGANHRAIGAEVRIRIGGQRMVRLITAGTSSLGQEPAEAFFGVGDAKVIDRVVIRWPGKAGRTVLRKVRTDQVLEVKGPRAGRGRK